MDAMALLCTLHADGPATLKRLRQAGCSTLESLEALDAERLAALVASTPAAARRLQKEARGLRERLHGGTSSASSAPARAEAPTRVDTAAAEAARALDAELASSSAVEVPRAPLPSSPAFAAAAPLEPQLDERSSHSAANPGESVAIELPAREKRLVQRVVDAWRTRDAEETTALDAAEARLERVRPAERGEELAVVPPSELGTPLHPQDLDGLDADLVARLSAAGYGSLEALAHADVVELVQRVPAGYSRLARLAALARRALPPARAQRTQPPIAFASVRSLEQDKLSRSELPFALKRPDTELDLPDGLKRTPVHAPKDRPTRFDSDREGAGGPFV